MELKPQNVFRCFAEINKIPRPSNKEEKMMAFLKAFGEKLGLETLEDETGNILIRKPATQGYENKETTLIQSHMDMVCEKESGLDFNFLTDAIQTEIDGDWMKAKGTTLGADDGIGVAMEMALLEDKAIEHGPIECLFTRAEETSLGGARGLKAGWLKGKYLLNLDSEDEGEICISCAGGANTNVTFNATIEDAPKDHYFYKMQVKGLVGGHSGDDIEKKRANANILLARLLLRQMHLFGVRIADIQSGGLHNAIPRDGFVVCCIPFDKKEELRIEFNKMVAEFEEEYSVTEKNMQITLESKPTCSKVIDKDTSDRLIKSLIAVPNGVFAMSQDIEGAVETSSNLASVRLKGNKIHIETMQRSCITSKRLSACDTVKCVFDLAGADVEVDTGYTGWFLNPASPLLQIAVDSYEHLFGIKPKIRTIHGGLECGLFSEKYPEMDMISFGPTMCGVHSPDEKLLIPTVEKVWQHLLEILKNIPEK